MDRPLVDILRAHDYFSDMREQHFAQVVNCAGWASYNQGDLLMASGEPADAFYIVLEGQVLLELSAANSVPVTLHTARPGEVIGWSWVIPPYTSRRQAVAASAVQAARFDAVRLRERCRADHTFGLDLMRRSIHVMTRRLAETRRKVLEFYY